MSQKQKENIRRKTILPLIISVFLVVVFSVLQALESKSANPDTVILSTTVAQNVTLDCGADVSLGTLTPGTPVPTTDQHTTCTTTTNAESGYDLKVRREDTDTTMDHATDATANITDKADWTPGTPNAVVYSSTGLGFSVFASTATKNITWWGAGTTYNDALNQYAGFPPTTYATIMDHDTYSSGSTTVSIAYRLDVPSTQKSGSYTGTVGYQVTSKP